MTELWLNFKDENGSPKRVLVEGEKFTVGRTPDNDLSIPIANLSRRHIQIERFGDIFILSDAGSSNGTTLDETEVTEPVALKNGNKLNLGGGAEIEIEIISDDAGGTSAGNEDNKDSSTDENKGVAAAVSVSSAQSVSASSNGSSIPFGFFILAPLLGFFILAIAGIFIIANSGGSNTTKTEDVVYKSETPDPETDEDDLKLPANKQKDDPTPAPTVISNSSSTEITTSGTATPAPTAESIDIPSTPKPSSDADKIERSSVSFLRRIAANDSRPFLTGKQITIVNPKINQFKGSSAVAENLKNAKQNSSQIEELARSKNLRPQFVATAALAQLGNQRGDVAKTAQGMIEVLANLRGTFGNELANDNLLMIAVYDQGVADKIISTRDMIAKLANEFPNQDARTIRTIWFLKENGKLSDAQFEFVLKFLAIGIITQNPKDFNVQSDAVIFN